MAEQAQNEYEQYAPKVNGKLFSNAMFGFNKEEVLAYLEELANENSQRQNMAAQRIQELDSQLRQMETSEANTQQLLLEQDPSVLNSEVQQQLQELANALQVSREASMQAEEELAEAKEKLYTAQNENIWLREEHQKTDLQVAELRRQLDEASQGQWFGAEEQIAELRRQLEELATRSQATETERDRLLSERGILEAEREAVEAERDAAEAERDAAEAERDAAEAERDAAEAERDAAEAERDAFEIERDAFETEKEVLEAEKEALEIERNRLQALQAQEGQKASLEQSTQMLTAQQIVADANEEAEHVRKIAYAERDRLHRQILNSAGGLVSNIGTIREDINSVEGEVTNVLESVQESLAQLLVSLNHTEHNLSTLDTQVERFPSPSPSVPAKSATHLQAVSAQESALHKERTLRNREVNGLGNASFHRVSDRQGLPSSKVQYFRPSFSNGTESGPLYTQTARALPGDVPLAEEARMRALTDTLVDTLRQMLD